ncbi:MAG TPA: PAS domain-containing sensor histidine kinase [Thermoanaerobaculia bacterium]|nr:PAS domain-containing sensor histidine kinase [Thermoanaerobaculia bacterium]
MPSSWWRRFWPGSPEEPETVARYQDLVENSLGLICTHDLAGRLLSINPAGADLLGYTPAQVVGRNLRDLLVPEVRPLFDEYLSRVRDLTSDSGYMVVQSRSGEPRVLFYRNRLCHRPDREPYVLGHAQDMTEQRRAERAEKELAGRLRESEARYRSLFEEAPVGIYRTSPDGHILFVNPAVVRMLGYGSEEELLKRNLESEGGDAVYDRAIFRKLAERDGGFRGLEAQWRRRDGSPIWVRESAQAVRNLDGEVLYYEGTVEDVSEHHELEELKSQFVSTVSHELRTPLTSLRGALGLLAAGVLGDLPGEARSTVEIAQRSIVRLCSLVNDILDIERIERGQLSLQIGSHSLASLLDTSVEEIRPLAQEAGIILDVNSPAGEVQGDGDRLMQVIVNLLSNALKFSPRGSTVRLRALEIPDGVEVQVEDQGRGIPPSHHKTIFERFRQVETSDSASQRGAGLGLAIARSIVEMHGGRIGVESEPGKGSTFWFRIPRSNPDFPGDVDSEA